MSGGTVDRPAIGGDLGSHLNSLSGGTRPEPRAKPGPFPSGTDAPVLGGRFAEEHRRKQQRFPRNPRVSSGKWPTATSATPDVPSRERRCTDRGARRGRGQLSSEAPPAEREAGAGSRGDGQGPCRRRITQVEIPKKPSEAHAGSLVMLGPEDGAGTHSSASLCISSPSRRGQVTDSSRGPSLFHLPVGTGIGGTGPAFREHEEGSDDRTGPTLSATNST
jgi:hypothetical protein